MLRIAVTDVDAFRYWRGLDDAPVERLRDRLLRREDVPESVQVGRAVHEALERAVPGQPLARVEVGDGLAVRVDCDATVPDLGVRECAVERVVYLPTADLWVRLTGRVDATDGRAVHDYKTVSRFDPEALHDALQWRCYLWMLDAHAFVWHVFEVYDPLQSDPGVYRIVRHHQVTQYRYPGMADDCLAALEEFVGVVRSAVPEYVAARTTPDPECEAA